MSAQHTPGPYTVREYPHPMDKSRSYFWITAQQPSQKHWRALARVVPLDNSKSVGNAHLFGAAPEMLEALEAALDMLRSYRKELETDHSKLQCPVERKIVLAIKKAKGE